MSPTLGIVIPTAGRATLRRTLDSLAPQMRDGDRCLVVGDTLDGPLPQSAMIAADYPWCRYLSVAGERHTWGNEQINTGLRLVGGDWLMCQDDDDIYVADALDAIRVAIATIHRPRPLLFRFRSYHGGQVYWDDYARSYYEMHRTVPEGHIGGHCLVTPNRPRKVADRGTHYQGDHTWIADTLARWAPIEPLWVDKVIAIARPS